MGSRYKNPYLGIVKDTWGNTHSRCPRCNGRWVTTDSVHCENHDDVNTNYCVQTFAGGSLPKDTYVFAVAIKDTNKLYSISWVPNECRLATRKSVHEPWSDREVIEQFIPYNITLNKLKLYFTFL